MSLSFPSSDLVSFLFMSCVTMHSDAASSYLGCLLGFHGAK